MANQTTLETLEKHLTDIEKTIVANGDSILSALKYSIRDNETYGKLVEILAGYDRQLIRLTVAIGTDIRKLKESKNDN